MFSKDQLSSIKWRIDTVEIYIFNSKRKDIQVLQLALAQMSQNVRIYHYNLKKESAQCSVVSILHQILY